MVHLDHPGAWDHLCVLVVHHEMGLPLHHGVVVLVHLEVVVRLTLLGLVLPVHLGLVPLALLAHDSLNHLC